MPDAYLHPDGNDVTAAFHTYVRPLVGSGLPEAHRIRADKVGPRLAK